MHYIVAFNIFSLPHIGLNSKNYIVYTGERNVFFVYVVYICVYCENIAYKVAGSKQHS